MKPQGIPFFKPDDDASPSAAEAQEGSPSAAEAQEGSPSAAEAQEGPPSAAAASDNEGGDLDEGPPVDDDGNEPASGGEVVTAAVEGHPADGNGPPPRRSRYRRKGCPSPHKASFAQRETHQKGRRVSAAALFSAPWRKTFFVGGVGPFLSVIIIVTLAVS